MNGRRKIGPALATIRVAGNRDRFGHPAAAGHTAVGSITVTGAPAWRSPHC